MDGTEFLQGVVEGLFILACISVIAGCDMGCGGERVEIKNGFLKGDFMGNSENQEQAAEEMNWPVPASLSSPSKIPTLSFSRGPGCDFFAHDGLADGVLVVEVEHEDRHIII